MRFVLEISSQEKSSGEKRFAFIFVLGKDSSCLESSKVLFFVCRRQK